METKDFLMLSISFLSLFVAAVALGWNIYRDIIRKATVKVEASYSSMQGSGGFIGIYFAIVIKNRGPGKVKIEGIYHEKKSILQRLFFREGKRGFLTPDSENPFSGVLPVTLEETETHTLLFNPEKTPILPLYPIRIGVRDSYDRMLWVRSKSLKRAYKKWKGKKADLLVILPQ